MFVGWVNCTTIAIKAIKVKNTVHNVLANPFLHGIFLLHATYVVLFICYLRALHALGIICPVITISTVHDYLEYHADQKCCAVCKVRAACVDRNICFIYTVLFFHKSISINAIRAIHVIRDISTIYAYRTICAVRAVCVMLRLNSVCTVRAVVTDKTVYKVHDYYSIYKISVVHTCHVIQCVLFVWNVSVIFVRFGNRSLQAKTFCLTFSFCLRFSPTMQRILSSCNFFCWGYYIKDLTISVKSTASSPHRSYCNCITVALSTTMCLWSFRLQFQQRKHCNVMQKYFAL